jgi:hypothetical protein
MIKKACSYFVVVLLVGTLSYHQETSPTVELCGYLVPAESTSLSWIDGPDFTNGSFRVGQDTVHFYCGSFPDLGMTLQALIIKFPAYAIEFEKQTKIGRFNFVQDATEPSPFSIEHNQKLVDEYGIYADFPETNWDTLSIYQVRFESHSAWISVPTQPGMAEIVLIDSTLSSYSTSIDHSRSLQYKVLALYFNNVSLRDTTSIFNFVNRIDQL